MKKDKPDSDLKRFYKDYPTGLCQIDRNFRIVKINELMAEVIAVPTAKCIGKTFSELFPVITDSIESSFRQVIETEEPILGKLIEAEIPSQPGFIRTFKWNYVPTHSDDGTLSGISCTVEDITEMTNMPMVLETLAEKMGMGISVWDSDLRLITANGILEQMLDFPAGSLVPGVFMGDLFRILAERGEYGEGDAEEQVRERVELAKLFEPHSFERKCLDGTVFEIRGAPMPGGGFVSTHLDITERRKAEEKFEKSKRQFYALADASPYIIFRTDAQGQATYVNKQWSQVSGLTDRQWVGDGWSLAVHPEDREEVFNSWQQAVIQKKLFNKEFRFKHIKNGNVIWLVTFAKPIFTETGDVEGFVGIGVNITERKQAEEALNESEERFRSLVESTTSIIWTTDESGGFVVPQSSWEKYTGQPWSEHKDLGWTKKIHPDDIEHILKAWEMARQERSLYETWGRIWNANLKTWCDFEVRAVPIINQDGSLREWIGIITDITERKEMEGVLLDSEKLKSLGTITAGVAHEFNNILAVMVGSAELLESGFEDEKELKKVLHDIIKAGDDGAEIVKNMLKFAKPEGKNVSDYIFFDIRHLIDEALDFTAPRWRNMAQAHGIDYKIDKEGMREIPDVLCNTTEVREVFTNIINNALDAMPDGGYLSFSTWSDEDTVFISISDTGNGMPEEVKRKIFDPFFTTRRPLGTGLGMSVSYSIIMRHGGRIEVESEIGKGATFNLTIPIGKNSIQKTVPLEPAFQATTRKLHVLVVDDNDDMCVIMGNVITRDGHTVKTVNNGAGAIELFGKEDFDLVLCDIAMPDVYGYEVIKAINNSDKMPKIGIMTGWDEKLKPIDDEEFKVDFILKKPFKHAELTKHINKLFGADGK